MKKFLGELLASILIVVMTVGSLPNMSYADELLVSTDAYYSETEEGPDGTELIEENLEETDEELPEEISEEGEEESLPAEEVSEDESVAEGEEITGEEETVLEEEILGEEEELLDEESSEGELSDEELLSDELLEEAFNSEAEYAVSPTNDYLIIEGTKVTGIDSLNYLITYSTSPSEIVIPEGITEIGESAFADKNYITDVKLPQSLKIIGKEAFSGCSGLEKIEIPNSVTKIGSGAFKGCSNLEEVNIPNHIEAIEDHVFYACKKLSSISIPNSVKTIGDHAFCVSGLTEVSISTNVKVLGDYAFAYCENLKKATIGSEIIGKYSFNGCSNLSEVSLLNIYEIEEFGLPKNTKLTELIFSNRLTSIRRYFFYQYDISECDVVIPANVTEIGEHAFEQESKEPGSKCDFKTFAFAGNKVTKIGENAFENVKVEKGIKLPDSVLEIEGNAFKNCSLGIVGGTYYLPGKIEKIKDYAFVNTGIEAFYIPSSISMIESKSFGDTKESLSSIKFIIDGDSKSWAYQRIMNILKSYGCDNPENVKCNEGIEKSCHITYVLNGGYLVGEVPTSFISDSKITFPDYSWALVKRTGYSCEGFYLDSKFKQRLDMEDVHVGNQYLTKDSFQKSITLYVKWVPNTYKVQFDLNAPGYENGDTAKGTMPEFQTFTYDKAAKLTKNAYSFAKWKFTGWNTKANGSGVTYKDMASVKNLATNNNSTVTLYAQWQPLTYTVKFDGNTSYFGGKVSGKMPAVKYSYYTDLGKVLPTNKFTCPGMTFKGWRLQSDLDATPEIKDGDPNNYDMEELAAKNKNVVTLYAVWERNKYKLEIYDYTGTKLLNSDDSGKMFETGYSLSSAYSRVVARKSITGSEIVGNGYSFVNFYTEPNGKGKKYTAASVMALENGSTLKLYLKKKPITYKLVCDLDGGKAGKKLPTTYTVETASFALIDDAKLPTKPGYTFAGWEIYTDRNVAMGRSTTITQSTDTFNPANHTSRNTIKALWNPIKYSVYLNPVSKSYKEGTLSSMLPCKYDGKTHIYTDEIKLYDDSEKNLKTGGSWNQTKRTEYSITGWSTKPDGKGKVFSNGTVNLKDLVSYANGTDSDGSTKITLYAVWSPKKYNIIYDLDGGTLSSAPKTYTYSETKSVKIGTPKKAGYVFDKWVVPTALGCFDSASNTIMPKADRNIYLVATWKPIQYNVVFNPNSKTAQYISGPTKLEGIEYTESGAYMDKDIAKYINPGYTFAGYNTKANGKGISLSKDLVYYTFDGLSTKDGSTVTVYAQWTPNTYKVSYNSVDPISKGVVNSVNFSNWVSGYASNNNPSTYTYAPKGTITLKTPVKYGYVFEGWYEMYNPSSKTFSNKVTKIDRSVNKDVVLYAKWRVK